MTRENRHLSGSHRPAARRFGSNTAWRFRQRVAEERYSVVQIDQVAGCRHPELLTKNKIDVVKDTAGHVPR